MKLYLVAGEASGDMHAAALIQRLREWHPDISFRGQGGDRMQAAGAELFRHYRRVNYMGFFEVIRHLPALSRALRQTKTDILTYRPDALILVDYPGFNLRLARFAKQKGIPVIYYIAPQVWAWHRSRLKNLRRDVDLLITILPFEKDFFGQSGIRTEFAGHPLVERINQYRKTHPPARAKGKPLIALLPGSRRQEIRQHLPRMLRVTRHFPEYRFAVAGISLHTPAFYHHMMKDYPAELVTDQTYDLLIRARAALVSSGTATLETALFDVPQVVCYRSTPISFWIGKQLVKVPFISLVNLIAGKKVVEELIQNDMNPARMKASLKRLLQVAERNRILAGYTVMKSRLGDEKASENAAKFILDSLSESG